MGKRPPSPTSGSDIELGPHSRPSHHPPYIPQPQQSWFPWLVPLFFLINVAAFGVTMYFNDCPDSGLRDCMFSSILGRFSFEPFSENPLFGPSVETLDEMGALNWKKVVRGGELWRLITCIWLHAGVAHLFANMMSLLFVGIRLEQEFGFLRIGLLYILCGFGGSLLSALSPQIRRHISVGASGALFGLLGAMLSELITNWSIYANKCAALLTLVVVIAINLAVGLLPHVDRAAHIGGFISGFLLGFILLIRPQFGYVSRNNIPPGYQMDLVKPKHKTYQYLLWIVSFVILMAGYIGGLLKLFQDDVTTS